MLNIVTLTDAASGSTASIAPALGFNCFEFKTQAAGDVVDVLWSHPNFTSGGERPSGSGIPLLFPFAGRIQGIQFHYEGRDYPLEPGDAHGNAIHGFVMQRPWRVVEQSAARVTGEFHASQDDPTLLDRWPCDFRIRVSYALRDGDLISMLRVDNPADRPLPFALATHAYFRLPVGPGGTAAESIITVPVRAQWELADLRPTGKLLGLGPLEKLPDGMRLGDAVLDNVLTGLKFDDGRCTTRIENPAGRRTLVQAFDESFRHAVVYTPPHREAICIEPYTSLPEPLRLEQQGIQTGFRRLPPGENFETAIRIGIE